jgi:hypothetical protein
MVIGADDYEYWKLPVDLEWIFNSSQTSRELGLDYDCHYVGELFMLPWSYDWISWLTWSMTYDL